MYWCSVRVYHMWVACMQCVMTGGLNGGDPRWTFFYVFYPSVGKGEGLFLMYIIKPIVDIFVK